MLLVHITDCLFLIHVVVVILLSHLFSVAGDIFQYLFPEIKLYRESGLSVYLFFFCIKFEDSVKPITI